ncbi:hypothetical protein FT663_01431 [Candidozyma haemuli var. vulneris]|uniref:Ribosomal RNA-processing protein 40 n=1 Tax=Candidozyma haemuli TaxID=45357 RepID=A0A2V1AP12_9ASCO|nr:hypothetical protein CXQ85_003456 [[Candida] haemuloni]KAF3991642.1 hypothetical protein FT662_01640 [[Candida] haemuloni var. vulneris]KAF3994412.1 hypothetical protein FT663_01431 [[Candida] haemuloni var. vulneris]PVH19609.1 hypothetical protein CXQ85_003456 [[Candida] haemuloni]
MSRIIIPGDSLSSEIPQDGEITIGPGIYKVPQTQQIIPQQAGYLKSIGKKSSPDKLVYIDANSKRYTPQVNDFVVGVVSGVYGDFFKISLQDYSQQVQLSMMAFPNASKKNRPNLKLGQAVYARVSEANPEIDVEIECIDPETGKEGGFGPLDESGFLFEVNLNFARELLFNKSSIFLEKLAAKCAFEIAIGINGRIWIKVGEGLTYKGKETKEGEDVDMDQPEATVKDMRLTIAAAKYLQACQRAKKEDADAELKKAFKGTGGL